MTTKLRMAWHRAKWWTMGAAESVFRWMAVQWYAVRPPSNIDSHTAALVLLASQQAQKKRPKPRLTGFTISVQLHREPDRRD